MIMIKAIMQKQELIVMIIVIILVMVITIITKIELMIIHVLLGP